MSLPRALLFGLYAYNTSRLAEWNIFKFDIQEFYKKIYQSISIVP